MWRVWLTQLGILVELGVVDENGTVTVEGYVMGAFVLIVIIAVIVSVIRVNGTMKYGKNSPDKQRIAEIVAEVAKTEPVTAAYAFWETEERHATSNKVTHRYWWYAIGFNNSRLYVIPIKVSGGQSRNITYQNYFVIEPEQLGLVNGKKGGDWVELYDKEGEKLVSLKVWKAVTGSRGEPVVVTQEEALEKWKAEFIPYWMDKVNTANKTTATGYYNNAKALDFAGRNANVEGGGRAKNM